MTRLTSLVWSITATARHPGMWSQVDPRKHQYQQSYWRWWNSSWAISDPKRWCCYSATLHMQANLENTAVATGLEKVTFHSNPKERQRQRMFKLPQICTHHMLEKQCRTFSKQGFNSTWTKNFQMFQLDLEKAEGPEFKLPTSTGSLRKQESSRKTSTSALLTTPKPLAVWITTNCGRFFKTWDYQTTWPASWEICMHVKSNSWNRTWNNRLVPNRERSMSRLYIVIVLI